MKHGGRLLVDCLQTLGARHGFGVPGESYLAVLDGLHDTKGAFDFIVCRNEGGAGFMSAAYGKLTGTPGLCFVTRGPGGNERLDRSAYRDAGQCADDPFRRPDRHAFPRP